MSILVNNEYDFGEVVYLKTDPEQHPAIIFSINIYKAGEIMYEVIRGTVTSKHYDFELTRDKNLIVTYVP
jgi:hypothetical protein